jgi:peptide alpha-N-acetyltransferase
MTTTTTTPDYTNPQAGAGRPLPKRESDLFKSVVKHYEMKQYKKAIKQADNILKKFPNHGETLAMKGLTLNYMSRRDEAHELVKQGLMNDMKYVSTSALRCL